MDGLHKGAQRSTKEHMTFSACVPRNYIFLETLSGLKTHISGHLIILKSDNQDQFHEQVLLASRYMCILCFLFYPIVWLNKHSHSRTNDCRRFYRQQCFPCLHMFNTTRRVFTEFSNKVINHQLYQ